MIMMQAPRWLGGICAVQYSHRSSTVESVANTLQGSTSRTATVNFNKRPSCIMINTTLNSSRPCVRRSPTTVL